eukprot:TRINITY_DN382_c0_g1_i1.p1 TRINITY_DN382_c0_g1~~TRINITY_DN382_c0_g1_i1.p1  ORF type:complete len:234 (-),score=46.03 TRINITY_DN382_c0_g1_i1:894-1595(-)
MVNDWSRHERINTMQTRRGTSRGNHTHIQMGISKKNVRLRSAQMHLSPTKTGVMNFIRKDSSSKFALMSFFPFFFFFLFSWCQPLLNPIITINEKVFFFMDRQKDHGAYPSKPGMQLDKVMEMRAAARRKALANLHTKRLVLLRRKIEEGEQISMELEREQVVQEAQSELREELAAHGIPPMDLEDDDVWNGFLEEALSAEERMHYDLLAKEYELVEQFDMAYYRSILKDYEQ